MDIDNRRAIAAGLTLTDPAVTLAETRAWMAGQDIQLALPQEREAALMALAARVPAAR